MIMLADFKSVIELIFAVACGSYSIMAIYVLFYFWYILKYRIHLASMIVGSIIFTSMFGVTMILNQYAFSQFYIWIMGFGVLCFNSGIYTICKQHFKNKI